MYSLLYVDDEPGLLEIGKLFLESTGDFTVTTDLSGKEGLARIAQQGFDAIVSDYQMPEMDGIEFLKSVRTSFGNIPFILFTGRGREEVVIEAINNGADFYLQKGGDPRAQFAELAHKIRQAVSRRRAEFALQDSEKRLADIINFLPDATFAIDNKGRVIAWNKAIEEMTGVPSADIVGKSDHEYGIPFYGEKRPILIDLVFRDEDEIRNRYPFVERKDDKFISEIFIQRLYGGKGAYLWFIASPLYDAQGTVVGAIESIRDITDRKKAEGELRTANEQITANEEELRQQLDELVTNQAALRESEEKFRDIIETSPDLIWEIDTRGVITYMSPRCLDLIGYYPQEIAGRTIFSLVPDHELASLNEVFATSIRTKIPPNGFYLPVHCRDGHTITMDVRAVVHVDDAGQLIGFRGLARDITEKKSAEEALNKSERRFRELADLLPQGIYEADVNGRMTYVNRRALEMFGYAAEDVENGLNVISTLAPEDRQEAASAFRTIAEQGSTREGGRDYKGLRKDGSTFPVSIFSSPILLDGKTIGVRGILIDTTESKKAEEELRAVNEQLAASSEELREQYDELAEGEKRIRENEARLGYMLGFYEFSGKSEKELLDYAVEGAGIITESPLGYLAFLSIDESELTMYAWSKSAMAECSMQDRPIVYKTGKTGLWGEAVRQRKAVITNDYEAENVQKRGYPKGHPRIIRHMNVPVFDEGRIVLVAGVANKPSNYTERDKGELTLLMQGLWTIIKRKRAEQTRMESEGKFRAIIENSLVGMHFYELKPDGTLVFTGANPGADAILGIQNTQFVGRTLEEAFPGLSKTEIPDQYRKIAAEGGSWQSDKVFYDTGNIHRTFSVSAFQVSPGSMVAMFIDVTSLKIAERELQTRYNELTKTQAELRRRQQQMEEIATTVPGVVYQFYARPDGSMGVYYASRRSVELLGIGADLGNFFPAFEKCVHPDDRERFMDSIRTAVISKAPWVFVGRFIKPSGETIWFRGMSNPVMHGDELVFSGVIQDITDLRKTEEDLARNSDYLTKIFASVKAGIMIVDAKSHQIIDINPAASGMIGLEKEEIIGKICHRFVCPAEEGRCPIMDLGQVVDNSERPLITATGRKLPIIKYVTHTNLYGRDCLIETFVDNSERHKVEEELQAANEQLTASQEELKGQIAMLAQNERQIQESEEKYRMLVEVTQDIIYSLSGDGTVMYVSPQVQDRLGYRPDEIVGHRFQDFIHSDDGDLLLQHIREHARADSSSVSDRFRIRRKDGVYRWFEDKTIYTTDRQGHRVAVGTIRDITEERAWQDSLRESEERYRLIAENSPDMIYLIDTGGYIRYLNPLAAKTMGALPESITGKHLSEIFRPELAARHLDAMHRVMETRTPIRREIYEEFPSGKIWIDVRLTPVSDPCGRIIGVLGLSHDISDRKQAEEAVRESEMKYRVLVENSHDIVYTLSSEGIVTFVSPSWTSILGHDTGNVTGRPFREFIHPADVPACEEFLERVISTGQRQSGIEYRVFHADGSVRIHSSTISPIFDDQGAAVSYVGTARDITETKQFQNAIRESNRKLNLLSSITRHDVANQLTVVQGYTQLAALRKPDPVIGDFLAKISSAVDTIQHQIEFTRTYQDLGVQAPTWFRVSEVIESVKPPLLTLDCTCTSCEIFADPMIDKVFFNLFDNAMRYGERVTTVTVRCGIVGDELVITFADNGVGIPLNEKQRIFEKGFGKHTGFGLFLVREILAITSISIHETGSHGKGALFEISVPKGAYRTIKE